MPTPKGKTPSRKVKVKIKQSANIKKKSEGKDTLRQANPVVRDNGVAFKIKLKRK